MSTTPADDGRIDITGFKLAALTAMMLLSFAAAIAMPFNITGIVDAFVVSNTVAGLVATIEMGGVAVSSLIFAQIAPRLNPRRVYVIGVSAVIALNVATIWAPSIEFLYVVRGMVGLFAGAMVATVMSTAGRSRTPEATFGVINSAVGVMGMALSLILPQALKLHTLELSTYDLGHEGLGLSTVDGLYFVYLCCAGLALLFIRFVPVPPRVAAPAAGDAPAPSLPLSGWLALLGLGIIFFGHGTLTMFIISVGVEQVGLSPERVGLVFMFGGIVGIVAPLVAGYVGTKYKALLPTAIIIVAVVIFGMLLSQASTPLQFYMSAPFFAMMPIAMMPIVLGALARIDPTGRLTGAHPAFITLGGALAPLVGGAISTTGNYSTNGLSVLVCAVVGSAFLFSAIRTADRMRGDAQGSPVPAPGE
ncbi:MAG: MFS transporter [Alphaproteobacteria bacterium]